MRKKLLVLLGIFVFLIVGSYASMKLIGSDKSKETSEEEGIQVVTSFYPMYILTSNIVKGVEGVSVENLTENQTGCLHDYQLTTNDMRTLANADYFVMNGGGMEGFVEEVVASYPKLQVITASEGIELLPETSEHDHDHDHSEETAQTVDAEEDHDHETEEDHDHEAEVDHDHESEEDHDHEAEEDHDHDHGDYNAHVWMDMNDYLVEIENVTNAFMELNPENAAIYEKNGKEYADKVKEVQQEYKEALGEQINQDIIIFHDAFEYLAKDLGMNVVYTIDMDSDTSLSAGEIKTVIDEVNRHGVKIMFTEEQFSDSIASGISKETDAKVYVINSLVTGKNSLDAYLDGMRQNLEVLKQAIAEQQ